MNIHPQSVHFPIALLIVAALFYLLNLLKQDAFNARAGYVLHILGVGTLIIAIFTGRYAVAQLPDSNTYEVILNRHEWSAYICSWLFGMLLIWQYLRRNRMPYRENLFFVTVYVLSLILIVYTAYLGGNLVYEHGAGVKG